MEIHDLVADKGACGVAQYDIVFACAYLHAKDHLKLLREFEDVLTFA